jgi:hypothetical protein
MMEGYESVTLVSTWVLNLIVRIRIHYTDPDSDPAVKIAIMTWSN